MQTLHYLAEIIKELNQTEDVITDEEAENLVKGILQSKKIFVAGSGRSGLMIKAFAMRMMQMGLDIYVVGETITPNLTQDDLLIVGSGSGETKSLVSMVQKAKSLDATVALVTINPESTLGQWADITVKLPGSPKDKSESNYNTIQPMGALFEQIFLLFCDAVILRLMKQQGFDSETMFGRHANLE